MPKAKTPAELLFDEQSTDIKNLHLWYHTNGVGYANSVIESLISPELSAEYSDFITQLEELNDEAQ